MLSGTIQEDSIPLPIMIISPCLFWRTGNYLTYVPLSLLQFFQVQRISVDSNIDMWKASFEGVCIQWERTAPIPYTVKHHSLVWGFLLGHNTLEDTQWCYWWLRETDNICFTVSINCWKEICSARQGRIGNCFWGKEISLLSSIRNSFWSQATPTFI